MPIAFNKEKNTWEDSNLTQEEKDSLINIAIEVITEQAGILVADEILHALKKKKANTKDREATMFIQGKFQA